MTPFARSPRAAALLAVSVLLAACASDPEPTPPPVVGDEATPHVMRMPDDPPPAPPLESLDWIVGRWEGTAFGGWVEEVWAPAKGGAMVGSFRLVSDGVPSFYELMLIVPIDGRLNLRVKHFNADMTPWEEGADSVNFPLIRVEGTTAWFDGLTWKREGDHLLGYLAMSSGGKVSEAVFRMERVGD